MVEHASSAYGPPSQEAIDARHETREIRVRGIVGFAIALVVVITLLAWISGVVLRWTSVPGEAISHPRAMVPEPALQPSPDHEQLDWEDLKQLRAKEDGVLHSYAWIGLDKHSARIPIDRAMDLLIQRGLPTRQKEVRP